MDGTELTFGILGLHDTILTFFYLCTAKGLFYIVDLFVNDMTIDSIRCK